MKGVLQISYPRFVPEKQVSVRAEPRMTSVISQALPRMWMNGHGFQECNGVKEKTSRPLPFLGEFSNIVAG